MREFMSGGMDSADAPAPDEAEDEGFDDGYDEDYGEGFYEDEQGFGGMRMTM